MSIQLSRHLVGIANLGSRLFRDFLKEGIIHFNGIESPFCLADSSSKLFLQFHSWTHAFKTELDRRDNLIFLDFQSVSLQHYEINIKRSAISPRDDLPADQEKVKISLFLLFH
ncbi:MAG: hypothetical protein A4E66_01225 [Syntrophus sp. PtaB.Bin001]|nr:MAG: hypothetical protein A4E66_01225 [Syntrophus sp. PtaB.Bin001]